MAGHTAQDSGEPPGQQAERGTGQGRSESEPHSFQTGRRATSAQGSGEATAEAVLGLGSPLRRQERVQEPRASRGLPAASGTPGGGVLFSCDGPSTSCVNHSQMGASGSFPPTPLLGEGAVSREERSISPSSGSPRPGALMGPVPLGTPPHASTCRHHPGLPDPCSMPGGASGTSRWGERVQVGPWAPARYPQELGTQTGLQVRPRCPHACLHARTRLRGPTWRRAHSRGRYRLCAARASPGVQAAQLGLPWTLTPDPHGPACGHGGSRHPLLLPPFIQLSRWGFGKLPSSSG